jgi:hypothetical protein
MGEQYFVLEKTWTTHFHKQLAAEKAVTPTVKRLRAWMDHPRRRGLVPEVGNLLILAFAEQTDRSFYLRGQPYSPSLDQMPDELELRTQPLPGDDEWEEAKRRAREVFGIEDFDTALRTAANVGALAGRVREKADAARDHAHSLVKEVRRALARLGASDAEIAQASRHRTAQAVDALLAGLKDEDATPALVLLARAPLATSGSAMSTSSTTAPAVQRALRDAKWDLFDGVARLDDERLEDAQDLIKSLRNALVKDEYVEGLEARLDEAETKAIRLLAPKRPIVEPPGPDGKTKVWKAINSGQANITRESWEAEAAKLAALLGDGEGRCRLLLTWRLEREEESP